MKTSKEGFEKLWLFLEKSGHESANIAIANCPDNWKMGHVVISTHDDAHSGFAYIFFDEKELDEILKALQEVRRGMR